MAEEPTPHEINEIIKLATKGRKATTMDDDTWKRLEDYLESMKNRGVNLNQINDLLEDNPKTVDIRPLREYIADRIQYLESGRESHVYTMRRTRWNTTHSSIAKGLKSKSKKRLMKKSNKRTRRRHQKSRRR